MMTLMLKKSAQKGFTVMRSKGFTLIELLIVIAVLGILAVVVIAAINPIEVINRGTDTGKKSDAAQLVDAFERYYVDEGMYPWQDDSSDADEVAFVTVDDGWATATENVLDKMSTGTTPEVKAAFQQKVYSYADTEDEELVVYKGDNADDETTVYVCFLPKSQTLKEEAVTRCGDAPSDFPDAEACVLDSEYVCVP